MKVEVGFLEGKKLSASFGTYTVMSDQSEASGGLGEFPEPADYFVSSLALCAAFYIRSFCDKRDIPTEGMVVTQDDSKDEESPYKRVITLNVELPADFPTKYRGAVAAAAKSCTVKKIIEAAPEFVINVK